MRKDLDFSIFATGTPQFLLKLGLNDADTLLHADLSWKKVLVSFSVSTALNLFYAPVMMTFHKITDLHIQEKGGSFSPLFWE